MIKHCNQTKTSWFVFKPDTQLQNAARHLTVVLHVFHWRQKQTLIYRKITAVQSRLPKSKTGEHYGSAYSEPLQSIMPPSNKIRIIAQGWQHSRRYPDTNKSSHVPVTIKKANKSKLFIIHLHHLFCDHFWSPSIPHTNKSYVPSRKHPKHFSCMDILSKASYCTRTVEWFLKMTSFSNIKHFVSAFPQHLRMLEDW